MTLEDIVRKRILGDDQHRLMKEFGAWGTFLTLLSNFFEIPWTRPIPTLKPIAIGWMFGDGGSALRALGRLDEAIDPMREGATIAITTEHWLNAAAAFTNLSELQLTLGNTAEAIAMAHRAVEFVRRTVDLVRTATVLGALAAAHHQCGHNEDAERLFEEAERTQKQNYPILYSLRGYQYCDLLLARGKRDEVLRRVAQTLPLAQRNNWLMAIGLDHLSLGRAHDHGSEQLKLHLDHAVDFLRRSGTLHHIPRALLARSTSRDLDEVFRIATRSGMRLYLTDYHLASGRLAFTSRDSSKAREHFAKADALINETGYHRRDGELAELRIKLG